MTTIKYQKKSQFYCNSCKKMIKGEGYLYNTMPLCPKHYMEVFPKFKREETQ